MTKEIPCEECCYVRDMTNIRPALCNFHQGYNKRTKEVLDILKKYKYNKNGSFDIRDKKGYVRISFKLFLKELKQSLKKEGIKK